MLKNYEYKDIEIHLIDGEKIETRASTINELGIHIQNKENHQFIPWTAIKKIKNTL